MIHSLYRPENGTYRTGLTPDEFTAALQDPTGTLWLDITDEPIENVEPMLLNTFSFHPLAVDDALREIHVPKVDDWETYLYVVLLAVELENQESGELKTTELDVFLGPNYIVTYHEMPITAVEQVKYHCERSDRHLKHGADHLLYLMADELVTDYMRVVEELDQVIDSLEDRIFNRPDPATVERIFTLKRTVVQMRRILSPQREVLNKLARDDYTMIDSRDRIYFRDVYDHLVRLHDINEGLRDLVSGVLDTHLSVINNRMNEIVKTLTIITTLFMPLTFLTGFFGMNFFGPTYPFDVWTGRPVFLLAMSAIILLPAFMYWWIRRRGWM